MKNKILSFSFFLLYVMVPTNARGIGYYEHNHQNCDVEGTVRKVVEEAVYEDPGVGAGLIRLLFHDCFVGGCDGSVLLDPTPANPQPEKLAKKNLGLRGFEVIDKAKEKLGNCRDAVSCADILAFAARDASEILNSTTRYNVTAGRLDSKVSSAADAEDNLPPPDFDLEKLKDLFITKKGLTLEDLVVLSGAHTIGRSHCSSFTNRLYPTLDPTLDQDFATQNLTKQCPKDASFDGVVNLDYATPVYLDNQYYKNVRDRKVLFFSDWSLLTSDETLKLVNEYADVPGDWEADFATSMEKLSTLAWITNPQQGEIRRNCRYVNY